MSRSESHDGMLVVYRENNPVQDMTLHQIAHAVTQIERAGMPLKNSYHNLNFWRGGAD